jgi:DNA (cytosine-5)-methyltransferase 1
MSPITARARLTSRSVDNRQNRRDSVGNPAIAPRVADLCCGMGGLSWAAHQLGLRVAAGVDRNKTAIRTFANNFPSATAILGSVRSSKILRRCSQLLAPLDEPSAPFVVVSGPPCQGFSAAGSRDPADPRNQLLTAVARAIVALKPHCALIENVSAVLADKHQDRLGRFEQTLCAGGYVVAKVLLDAADFGVPQKRKRAFFLIFRQQVDEQEILKQLQRLRQPTRNALAALNGLPKPPVRPDDYDDERDYGGIANHFAMQHSQRVMEKIASLEPGTGPMSYRRLHPSRPSNTLFSGHRAPPAHFSEPRSITVREAARLQGFPDDFRVYGSFANQMEQVTNAVPPPLATAVLKVLLDLSGVSVP